jgi:polysaccharide export outer membrane protein
MASLPPYRVAPPDILLIDALRLIPRPPYRIEPLDSLLVQFPAKTLPDRDLETLTRAGLTISAIVPVEPEGVVKLGLKYGSIPVAGLTLEEAKVLIVKRIEREVKKEIIEQGDVSVEVAQTQGLQQVRGEHLVRPDGTISLGTYGAVPVAGLTLEQVRSTVEEHLLPFVVDPKVSVDVAAYNSKVYYVVFDQGGYGMQITRLPVTGHETVLDALGLVNGITPVSSKHHIWVARPDPGGPNCEQILPVDLKAITQCGLTTTNYMLYPGDRIFVKADGLSALDSYLAKVIAPIERVFGIALLGSTTVRNLSGSGSGSGTGVGF